MSAISSSRGHAQRGYDRTVFWFERWRSKEVFQVYLAHLVASAADRPVHVLEVGLRRTKNKAAQSCTMFFVIIMLGRATHSRTLVDRGDGDRNAVAPVHITFATEVSRIM